MKYLSILILIIIGGYFYYDNDNGIVTPSENQAPLLAQDSADGIVTPSENCSLTDNIFSCQAPLLAQDIVALKHYADTITTLELNDTVITQAQLNNLPTFPSLDNLSLAYNRSITSLDLTKFPAITKLNLFGTSITSLNLINHTALTMLDISLYRYNLFKYRYCGIKPY